MTGKAGNPGRNWLMISIRCALAGLLGFALVTKLVDPSQLLVPLDSGLGLGQRGAAVGYIAVVAALLACIGLLVLRRGASGVLATFVPERGVTQNQPRMEMSGHGDLARTPEKGVNDESEESYG